MAVTPSYPGVYVQEVPSGVRTIVGVSTSIAVFIGRARQGPLSTPTECLNFSDFERTFSSAYVGSDLARAVRLFFQNGGTRCYVIRVASGATPSEVTLRNEAENGVLRVRAKSPGVLGDSIRMAVTYNGRHPEASFNLEVFRWATNSRGETVKEGIELWNALSMEPDSSRYAVDLVNQNSRLIELQDLSTSSASTGYAQSGRPVPSRDEATFRIQWSTLIGSAATHNRFRINVDNRGFVNVDLSSIDFSVAPLNVETDIQENLRAATKRTIDAQLTGGAEVQVSFEAGPSGPTGTDHENTVLLRIASENGDVQIEPAASQDLAGPLMLGSAQGGLEVPRFGQNRPAPNGLVFDPEQLVEFAQLSQSAFDTITIGSTEIGLGTRLQTVDAATQPRMYQDGYDTSATGQSDGIREKWAALAEAINNERANNPNFKWIAEVWGSRLALIPGEGGDNSLGTLSTGGAEGEDIGSDSFFIRNSRYYSLGPSGQGDFQVPAGTPASDGNAPQLSDYRAAFEVLDENIDLFNLMILPHDAEHSPATTASLWGPASVYCQKRRAFLLMDAPAWMSTQEATHPATGVSSLRVGLAKDYSALFYPRLVIREGEREIPVGPSGAIAGLMARIDSSRGVWKAPAGTEADLRGIIGLERRLSDDQNGVLNPRAINTLRVFPNGIVNWGARTMDGDDDFASEWKYIPIRRLALYIEESLYRGLKWVVFEPNDEPLWAQIRLNVGAFMQNLFRQGAFQGLRARDAYFVKCDAETTTQNDRNLGVVNIWVGFAPLKPAEFVILHLQQMAGQIQI